MAIRVKWKFLRSHSLITLYFLAALIGVGAGLGALAFGALIHSAEWFFRDLIAEQLLPCRWLFPVIPMFGIVVATYVTRRYAPEARGHGVPEVMAAVATRGGIIRARVVAVKAFASAITIGTGGSVGREGPIVQIGSALGSSVGQFLRCSGQRVRLLLACGAAAGISATFNAPIAGMMFAAEVILNNFSGVSIAPLIIASVMGTVVMRTATGGDPASLDIGSIPFALHSKELILFVGMGVLCGLGAWLFVKVLYRCEHMADKAKCHWLIKPLAAGLLVGVLGLFVPQVMGIGYETIESLFLHPSAEWGVFSIKLVSWAFGLFVLKMLTTSTTLAGGGSGGVFAPSLFLGAALGAATGMASHLLFDTGITAVGTYAICGMAAMVAGTTRAPITAILIVFEMTHNYQIILPLMLAVISAFVIATLLEKESIYTLKLSARGESVSRFGSVQSLASVHVKEVMRTDFKTFTVSQNVNDLVAYIKDGKSINFPLLDSDGAFYGFISTEMFRRAFFSKKQNMDICLKEIAILDITVLFPESSLLEAVEAFAFRDVSAIPVVDVEDRKRLVGMIYRRDIDQEYKRQTLLHASELHA
jgi:CIC family chloride channel protein